jgi:hypothetical protein
MILPVVAPDSPRQTTIHCVVSTTMPRPPTFRILRSMTPVIDEISNPSSTVAYISFSLSHVKIAAKSAL